MATYRVLDGSMACVTTGGDLAAVTEVLSGTLNVVGSPIEDTAAGDAWRTRKPGLKDWNANVTFHNDPADTKQIDLWESLNNDELVDCTFIVRTSAAAAVVTYAGTGLVDNISAPFVGLDGTAQITFNILGSGALTDTVA